MKRLALFGLVLLSGCVVQSFHPFYRDDAKVPLPQVRGEWDVVAAGTDTNIAYKPWVFTENDELVTYDDKNVSSTLRVTFFKVGRQLFCDFAAGEMEEGRLNPYWILHVRAVHTVAKVQLEKDRLSLVPMNFNWFKKSLAAKQVDLPHLKGKTEDEFLVTATPDQWAKFLSEYAADTNAFPQSAAYVLRKRATP